MDIGFQIKKAIGFAVLIALSPLALAAAPIDCGPVPKMYEDVATTALFRGVPYTKINRSTADLKELAGEDGLAIMFWDHGDSVGHTAIYYKGKVIDSRGTGFLSVKSFLRDVRGSNAPLIATFEDLPPALRAKLDAQMLEGKFQPVITMNCVEATCGYVAGKDGIIANNYFAPDKLIKEIVERKAAGDPAISLYTFQDSDLEDVYRTLQAKSITMKIEAGTVGAGIAIVLGLIGIGVEEKMQKGSQPPKAAP